MKILDYKYKMIFWVLFFLLISTNLLSKKWDCRPENSYTHIGFIVDNLIPGKKYIAKKNVSLLKKVISGSWDADEWGDITLKKSGNYTRKVFFNRRNIYLKGRWKLSKNYLLLKRNNTSKYEKFEIEYFIFKKMKKLSFIKEKKRYYYFNIIFTDDTFNRTNLKEFYVQFEEFNNK